MNALEKIKMRTGLPSPVQMKVKEAKCYCLSERNFHTEKLHPPFTSHMAAPMRERMQVWGIEESSLGSLLQDVLLNKDVTDAIRQVS